MEELLPVATPNNNGVVHAKDANSSILFDKQKMYLVYKGNTSAYTRVSFKLLFTSETDSFEIMITASTMQNSNNFNIVAYRIGGADLTVINSKLKFYYTIENSIPHIYVKNIIERPQSRSLTKYPIEGINTELVMVNVEETGLTFVPVKS